MASKTGFFVDLDLTVSITQLLKTIWNGQSLAKCSPNFRRFLKYLLATRQPAPSYDSDALVSLTGNSVHLLEIFWWLWIVDYFLVFITRPYLYKNKSTSGVDHMVSLNRLSVIFDLIDYMINCNFICPLLAYLFLETTNRQKVNLEQAALYLSCYHSVDTRFY